MSKAIQVGVSHVSDMNHALAINYTRPRGPNRWRQETTYTLLLGEARVAVRGDKPEKFTIVRSKLTTRRLAQAGSLIEDGIEHGPEFAGRGIDDLQDFGGRGLLLQRLVAFSKRLVALGGTYRELLPEFGDDLLRIS